MGQLGSDAAQQRGTIETEIKEMAHFPAVLGFPSLCRYASQASRTYYVWRKMGATRLVTPPGSPSALALPQVGKPPIRDPGSGPFSSVSPQAAHKSVLG
jgi:hypothetical protein